MNKYDEWELEDLRIACADRKIEISSKDGVKTLAARLRTDDKCTAQIGEKATEISRDHETLELSDSREVFEQVKTESKIIDFQGDLKVNHEYGKQGEIPQGPLSFNRDQEVESRGSLTFEERMTLLRLEREVIREREELEMRSEERRRKARMEDTAFELQIE